MKGKIESIELLETIDSEFHHMLILIDFDFYHLFDNYNEITELLNETVEFRWRYDIVNSIKVKVLCELALYHVVQTLDKSDGIKLIPSDKSGNACCNVDLRTIRAGDIHYGGIVILSDYYYSASNKASWIDMSVIDKSSRHGTIRMFIDKSSTAKNDILETLKLMVGKYIKCDISMTRYGYQTDEVTLYDVPVVVSQEVDIAMNVLNACLAEDKELAEYESTYDLLNFLLTVVSGELGYHIVAMAMEIMFINTIGDMSYDFDLKVLKRAVFCSRGYLLPTNTDFSKSVKNITKVLRTTLANDRELLLILDPLSSEDLSYTKWIYLEVSSFVYNIIAARRGTLDTNYITDMMGNLRSRFNNLI